MLCARCGAKRCVCEACHFRGSIKPAFEQEGTLPFLVEESLKNRFRVSKSLAKILQGWELIRYVSNFIPLEKRDEGLASALNDFRNKTTNLDATVTHVLTFQKMKVLPFHLKNKLLITLIDIR